MLCDARENSVVISLSEIREAEKRRRRAQQEAERARQEAEVRAREEEEHRRRDEEERRRRDEEERRHRAEETMRELARLEALRLDNAERRARVESEARLLEERRRLEAAVPRPRTWPVLAAVVVVLAGVGALGAWKVRSDQASADEATRQVAALAARHSKERQELLAQLRLTEKQAHEAVQEVRLAAEQAGRAEVDRSRRTSSGKTGTGKVRPASTSGKTTATDTAASSRPAIHKRDVIDELPDDLFDKDDLPQTKKHVKKPRG